MNAVIHQLEIELRRRIKRVSLREQIADGLAEQVASGLLQPGDELPSERELSSMLNVSRESLRGALQLLSERGVLDIGQGTKTRVRAVGEGVAAGPTRMLPQIDGMDDRAVFAARSLLEPDLAARAAAQISDEVVQRLAAMIDAQSDMVDDPVRFQISDREFHRTIFAIAGEPVLERFAQEAYDHAYSYRRHIIIHHDGVRVAVAAHKNILQALKSKNADDARRAMLAHIDNIRDVLKHLASDGFDEP